MQRELLIKPSFKDFDDDYFDQAVAVIRRFEISGLNNKKAVCEEARALLRDIYLNNGYAEIFAKSYMDTYGVYDPISEAFLEDDKVLKDRGFHSIRERFWKHQYNNYLQEFYICYALKLGAEDTEKSRLKEVVKNFLEFVEYYKIFLNEIQDKEKIASVSMHEKMFRSGEPDPLPQPIKLKISEKVFWEKLSDSNVDQGNKLLNLKQFLESIDESSIRSFARIFYKKMAEAYTYDLWALAYIVNDGCSDDSFMDFRAWLVFQGQETYDATLKSPVDIFKYVDPKNYSSGESVTALIETTYLRRAMKPLEIRISQPKQPLGKIWHEENVYDLYPEIVREVSA